ncbi:cupin domain-containing protein [Emticicia sp. BO119]|uniref:cupin domain-containing protein n=1 Tax=Emticicia sp. BO119 TaxID=2757768 RepID=UPI0015F0D4B8|nr:cupin domain-containing protein [Emticicia sp. BO119]MBA4853790.1 cupin domain-containing protein [Emticicia sp. BO119]
MAQQGQIIENKVTGEKVTFLATAADTDGKYLRFRLNVKPQGFVTVNHVHPSQDEKFEMKKGKLKVLVGKKEFFLIPGETTLIPKGIGHQWWNESPDEEAEMEVEFTPAGNMETFLEQYYGLCNEGKCDAKGTPAFMQIMSFGNEYELFVSGPPIGVQRVMSAVLGSIAHLMGYKKYYAQYAR